MLAFKDFLNKALEILCIILFIFITIIGTYQIVTRYVFNSPSTISEELLTYSFTWLALFAAALVFGKREHMRMGYFAGRMSDKTQKNLEIISEILIFLFSAIVLVYGGISITNLTSTQITASLGVPMSYIYVILPICGVIIMIYSIINIFEIIKEG
ncbi:MAG: TRAP transporter small permease [Lachnospirales bacterium]